MAAMSTPGFFDRKNPSTTTFRSSSNTSNALPASPHTPQRTISSTFSSPGTYRAEDEYLIFEIGSRYLRAGFAGENSPRCALEFGPSQSRRVGDYREWLPRREGRVAFRKSTEQWCRAYELWQLDVRNEDVGLVEDKLERAIRDAISRYILLDARTKRTAVILPSVLPKTYIESVLRVLYSNIQVMGVTLLPSPLLAVAAAGMRSGLVIDIGWHETTVTAVFELRQVQQRCSMRAMKLATLHMARLLARHGKESFTGNLEEPASAESPEEYLNTSFTEAEEAITRKAWCQSMIQIAETQGPRPSPSSRQMSGSWPTDPPPSSPSSPAIDPNSPSRKPSDLPFASFALPIESALLANRRDAHDLDDEEAPLPALIHEALIHLPPDVRGTCMSRIIFTGGGSYIPGLKSRLLDELSVLITAHGFDPVRGAASDRHKGLLETQSMERRRVAQDQAARVRYPANSAGLPAGETPAPIPAGLVMPEVHPIDEKVARETVKALGAKGPTGIVRAVETLGPWVGASLAVGLRVKGVVEVDKDSFLKDGLAGARKVEDATTASTKSKTSLGSGLGGKADAGWTLGLWG